MASEDRTRGKLKNSRCNPGEVDHRFFGAASGFTWLVELHNADSYRSRFGLAWEIVVSQSRGRAPRTPK